MKIYVTFLLFFLTFFNCNAQLQTVDFNNFFSDQDNSNKYYKDLNNYFDAFVGTWESLETNNITFRVILYKSTTTPSDPPFNYKRDEIRGDFFIIENIGTPEESIICQSNRFNPQTGNYRGRVIEAYSKDGVILKGIIYDNCVPENKAVVSQSLNMTLSNNNQEAQWNIFRRGGLLAVNHVIPTNTVLYKQ